MRAPDDITIHRLQVRANARDARGIADDLERNSWPLTETSRWVFVRELRLVADKAHVRHEAAQSLSRAIAGAVDGRTRGAEQAQAVHFDTLPDLLSCLVGDLLQGQASSKWYWHNWSYLWRETRSRALLRLLWDNVIYLPAVTVRLAQSGHLAPAWRELGTDGADQLMRELVRVCGLPAPSTPTPKAFSGVEKSLTIHAASCFLRHSEPLRVWREPLNPFNPGEAPHTLAALVCGLQWCPLLLSRDTDAVVAAFAQSLEDTNHGIPAISVPEGGRVDVADVHPGESDPAFAQPLSRNATAGEPVARATTRTEPTSSASATPAVSAPSSENTRRPSIRTESSPATIDTERPAVPSLPAERSADSASHQPAPVARSTDERQTAEPKPLVCHTHSGGFFYLINGLNQPNCQALLENLEPDLPSGWLWLLDIVQRFGGELDPSLLAFVAGQAGYEEPAELFDALPLNGGQPVFDWLSRHYARHDLWHPSLLAMPASIIASASHIDVHYPLNAVRLPVRLAGLDINPGWVPWLGRVVSFHYTEHPFEQE
jgi:hypothetical protein